MNGGTFTPGIEKKRPGIYFNFKTTAQQRITLGDRGTVALPITMSWGEPKTFISISGIEDLNKKVGLNIDDKSLLLFREAKKKAQTVLLYRLNEGEPAKAQISENFNVLANYGGQKGNEVTIQVTENVLDSKKRDVVTYVGTDIVDKQIVTDVKELKQNKYVSFSGEGEVTITAGVTLSGGKNGVPSVADYTAFLEAAETEYFDVIALPNNTSEQLKATFVAFIKRLRDDQGRKVQGVLPNYAADHEGIINVTSGVLLEDGTEITPAKATAWVAGASAGANFNQSLTFVEYEGAVDTLERLDNDQVEYRLSQGEFLFTFDARDRTVSVEKDINSLTTYTTEKNKTFAKNKIIRVLDAINNDLTRELKDLIKLRKANGNDIPASDDGLQLVKTLITQYLTQLQDGSGITGFDSETDITIALNEDRDGFLIDLAVQPVDAAEKFYFNVEVK
ncbi:phage tail sheath family protein [Bacillus altitudinis]|uniref:phage tail sheath family protein n=1 Tax=Bacillus altitudinis TaxID=293387 RepID=UPI00228249CF|nr:phage tail sheath family protein [Bacillus altitudinis]MCY7498243.1 phage tail sheath family protein [Bacillus altitudinis]MCY7535460.1 phage tail sheath family protein [Bacillus altitudinis]MCY7545477.1 phage tail sheath family protein [Bacillus altitudinis]MCY7553577.1 phage tail sheath family protein [Bacillus altitudinis]MCY7592187.1 phage tail sheath family protein [Bacillus altitudinis]